MGYGGVDKTKVVGGLFFGKLKTTILFNTRHFWNNNS
jgi:hypothetical protein